MTPRAVALMLPIVILVGCGSTGRFHDLPIVWRIDDTHDIPEPEEREFFRTAYFAKVLVSRMLLRGMELHDREPAWNTNALDEVPSSTWFTNRIGVRRVGPAEAARGASGYGPPRLPITVVAGKSGGGNPGFLVDDADGTRFLIKFDQKNYPAMQTAASVVVNRVLWTVGYHVPSDTLFNFARSELKLEPGAKMKTETLEKIDVTEAIIDGILKNSPRRVDGRYRASASQFLTGIPKGGFSAEGARADDENDRVPHQHRRELRGLKVFAAWLGHTDMKEDNTLDMYIEEDGRHFLRHYLIDFGEALGAHQAEKGRMEDGWEHVWDWQLNGLAVFSLGLWTRPWEHQVETRWLAIGAFGAEHFEPELWREAYPYWPFSEADAADLYWGAKLVMRFDRPTLEAIINEAQLSDPAAATYLVEALLERRTKIGAAWLEAVTPLDYFRFENGALCATDLGVAFGLAGDGVVERLPVDYDPQYDDSDLDPDRKVEEFRVGAGGRVCLPIRQSAGYVIDRLRVRRGKSFKPIMQFHYMAGSSPYPVGIIRVER